MQPVRGCRDGIKENLPSEIRRRIVDVGMRQQAVDNLDGIAKHIAATPMPASVPRPPTGYPEGPSQPLAQVLLDEGVLEIGIVAGCARLPRCTRFLMAFDG